MRYLNVDTISFTNANGNSYPIKDVREITDDPIGLTVDIKDGDLLDEIASRKEVYGDNGELQSWRLFDANIIKITENNFSLQNIKTIKVPR